MENYKRDGVGNYPARVPVLIPMCPCVSFGFVPTARFSQDQARAVRSHGEPFFKSLF